MALFATAGGCFRSTCSIGLPRVPGARPWARCGTAKSRRARSGSIRSRSRPRPSRISAVFAGLAGGDLCAADDVRRAGIRSRSRSRSCSSCGHRRRRRLGARSGGRRGRRGAAAGAAVRPRRIPAAVRRRPAAGGAVARAEGVVGTLARFCAGPSRHAAKAANFDLAAFSTAGARPSTCGARHRHFVRRHQGRGRCELHAPQPGAITSLIGPNGAGKTTVLNMIGGFYRPDAGTIRLGDTELAGAPAWRIARAGIARTYQTTQLFGAMSVLDNVLIALRRRAAWQSASEQRKRRQTERAEACSRSSAITARSQRSPATCRMSTGGWSKSRARSRRGRSVLLLDEPAAGLMRADKAALAQADPPHRRSRHRRHPGRARHGDGDGHLGPRRRARRRAR